MLRNLPALLNASFCKHETTSLSFSSGRQEFEVLRIHGCVHSSSKTDLTSVSTETNQSRFVFLWTQPVTTWVFSTSTHTNTHTLLSSPTRTFRHMDEHTTSHLWHKNQRSSSINLSLSLLPSSLCSAGSDWGDRKLHFVILCSGSASCSASVRSHYTSVQSSLVMTLHQCVNSQVKGDLWPLSAHKKSKLVAEFMVPVSMVSTRWSE